MSVLAHNMDQNRALREVQLTFNKVDCVFLSILERKLWMIHVQCQQTGARLAVQLKKVREGLELTDSRLLGITTDIQFSNYSMTDELQSTLEPFGIDWPPLRYHIPCMAHVV
jgi:hypothetical protein